MAIINRRAFTYVITFACAATLCVTALAHRMPGSLSTIKPNASTGSIEIVHRLHSHDAELGMAALTGNRLLTLDDLEIRARLALYVEEQFGIARVVDGAIGPRLPLELVGAELEGDFVLVYQEYYGELSGDIAVRDGILRDVFPEQVNHVNIAITDEVRSLTFSAKDEWLTLRLE